jgi:O-methyltransferase
MADGEFIGTEYLAVSLQQVQANFARLGLLDDRVKFLKGWFSDTLNDAPIGPISILRLDGDYYSLTMDALDALYDRVSDGGFVIVDDYNAFLSCKEAITDFCSTRNLRPDLRKIDDTAVYWRREPAA